MATHAHISKNKPSKHKFLELAVSVMAIAGPLFGLPQVVEIYASHDASSIALWSWIGFSLYSLVFLTYGIVNRLRPVITAQIMWLSIYALVIIGTLLYG